MSRGWFLDTFFDSEYAQRRDINQLEFQEQMVTGDLAAQGRQIQRLTAQVRELSATIGVLVKMLAESSAVDPQVMRYRVEAAIDEMHADADHVICARCQRKVPAARTLMTADGAICDPGCA